MRVFLLCALLGTVAHCKPGGFFRQEYQFKKSSSTYQNNQLQTKDDDQGFYHKQGDLEGPAKVQQHNEQSQYVSPDLGGLGETLTSYDNRDLTDEAERAFTNHGLGVQGLKNAGSGGRSYSSYSSYSSYGSTSTGKANLRELKQNLQRDLEECLRETMAKYRSEGSYRSQSYMESQLKANLTRLLQDALYKANPSSAVAYTVTATGVYNPQNGISQELTDMRNELERKFVGELHQEIQRSSTRGASRIYYDSPEVEDFNRPYVQTPKSAYSDIQYSHGNGNNRYVGANIQQREFTQSQSSYSENQATERTSYASALNAGRASLKPNYNTHSQARYQPIHVQINPSVSLTDVMQNVQNTIHKQISEALRTHEVKYSDSTHRLTNARPSYDGSLADFKEQVRHNLTDLIQRELEKNYGVQTKLQGYSFSLNAGNTANYKLEDFDDLKRSVENNLNTFLENTLRTQETRYQQQVSSMSVKSRDYTSHGPHFTKSLTDSAAYTSNNHQFTRSPIDSASFTSHNPQFTRTPTDSVPYNPQYTSSSNGYASHNQHASSSNAYSSSSYQSEELEEMKRRLQSELSRQLQKAVEDHRRSQTYTQQNLNTQELYQQLESELKRNITEQLQRSLQKSYGDQGRRGGYSYTVTSGVYNPSANYRTQDLDAMMKQMQFDLEKQLREQVNKQGNYMVVSSGPYVLHSASSMQPSNSFKKYQQFSSYSRSSGDSIGEDCAENAGVDHDNHQHRYKREAYGNYGHNPQYHQHNYQHDPYNFQQHERVYFHQQPTHHNHRYFQQPENEREDFHLQPAYAQHTHKPFQQPENEREVFHPQPAYPQRNHQHFQQPENERVDNLGQQPDDLDDLSQQPEDLGQQLVDLDNLGQQPEDLGQQLVDLDHLGQQSEDLGQRLEDQDFDNLGQMADNYDDYFELTPQKPKPAGKPHGSDQNPSSFAKPTYGNPTKPTYGNNPSSTNPIYENPSTHETAVTLAKPTRGNSLSFTNPIYESPSTYGNTVNSASLTRPTYTNPQKPTSVNPVEQKPQNSASLAPRTPVIFAAAPKFVQPANEIPEEEELGQQLEELGQEVEDLGGLGQQPEDGFENVQFGQRDESYGNFETGSGKPRGQQVEELGQQLDDLEQLGQQLEDLDGLTQQTEDVYGKFQTGQVLDYDWGQQNLEDFAKFEGQSQDGFGRLEPQSHSKLTPQTQHGKPQSHKLTPQTQPGFAKVEPQTNFGYAKIDNFGESQDNIRTPVNSHTAQNYDDVIKIEDLISATPKKTTYKPYRGIGLPRPTTTTSKPAVEASYGDFHEIEYVFPNHRHLGTPKKPRFDLNPPTQELEPDHFSLNLQNSTPPPHVYVPYSQSGNNKYTPMIYRDFNGERGVKPTPAMDNGRTFHTRDFNGVHPTPATETGRTFNTQHDHYPIHNHFDSPKPPRASSSFSQPDEDSQQLAKDIFGNVKPVNDFKNHGDYLEYVGDRKDITHMESADQISQKQENPLIHSQRGGGAISLDEARNMYIRRSQDANSPRYIQFNRNEGNPQSALGRSEGLPQKPENSPRQSEDFDLTQQSEDFNDLTQQSEDLTQQAFGNHDLTQQSEDLTQQSFRHHDLTQQSQDFRHHDLTQQSEDLTQQSQDFGYHDLTQQSEDLTQHSQDFRDQDLTQQSEDLTRALEDLTQQLQDIRDSRQKSEDVHELTQQSEDFTQELEDLSQRPKTSYEPARPSHTATVNNPPLVHYGRSLPNLPTGTVSQGGGHKINPLAESINEAPSTTEEVEVETEPAEPKGFWKSFGGKITNSFSTVKQKAKDLMG